MIQDNDIKIGCAINIVFSYGKEHFIERRLNSILSDILDESQNIILVNVPEYFGKTVDFEYIMKVVGKAEVWFLDKIPIKVGFDFLGYKTENKVKFAILKCIGKFERLQRREYFRLEKFGKIKFSVSSTDEKEAKIKYDANIEDLSGGGMSISTKYNIDFDTKLMFLLSFLSNPKVVATKIVRKQKKDGRLFSYGLKFTNIDEFDREEIIQYIFNEQRKIKAKT